MKLKRHILLALTFLLMFQGCGSRGKVIPISTFSSIYADMLIADSWLRSHPAFRQKADTTLFYDPIFERYGYTFEDYDASINHYLKNPDRMYKILRNAGNKLKSRQAIHVKRMDMIQAARELASHVAVYNAPDFCGDSLLWRCYDSSRLRFADSLTRDSLLNAWFVRDSIAIASFASDSVESDAEPADSCMEMASLPVVLSESQKITW